MALSVLGTYLCFFEELCGSKDVETVQKTSCRDGVGREMTLRISEQWRSWYISLQVMLLAAIEHEYLQYSDIEIYLYAHRME